MDPRFGGEQPIDPNPSYLGPPESYDPYPSSYPPSYQSPPYLDLYGQPAGQAPVYPQPGAYAEGPGYGYPYAPPANYGYPSIGYPGVPNSYYPQGDGRPGIAVAAAVLGYVIAGLLFLSGVVVLLGVSAVSDLNDGGGTSDGTSGFVVAGLANLLSGGFLVAGGVMITDRQRNGPMLLAIGAAICVVTGIFWLVQTSGVWGWAFIYCVPTIIATVFAFSGSVTRWLNGAPRSGGPATS
jgi:hypothetical protein